MTMSLNNVQLIGRLTKEMDVKKTTSGLSVSQFSIAVPRKGKKDETDFINCCAWRQSADFLGQYAKKGDQVLVNGHLQVRSYTTQDGQNRQVMEVIADEVSIQPKSTNSGASTNTGYQQQQSVPQQQNPYNYQDENAFTGDFSDDNFL